MNQRRDGTDWVKRTIHKRRVETVEAQRDSVEGTLNAARRALQQISGECTAGEGRLCRVHDADSPHVWCSQCTATEALERIRDRA